MGLALLLTNVIPLGGRIQGVLGQHGGVHALPWGSLSRPRPSLGGSLSLSLMAGTVFRNCLPFPGLRAPLCGGKLSFLLPFAVPADPSFCWDTVQMVLCDRELVALKLVVDLFGVAAFLCMCFPCFVRNEGWRKHLSCCLNLLRH